MIISVGGPDTQLEITSRSSMRRPLKKDVRLMRYFIMLNLIFL
jgi:hypothetical protein